MATIPCARYLDRYKFDTILSEITKFMNSPINIKFLDQWKLLLKAQTYCDYINDHTVYKDKYGNWRLLGTCAKGAYAFYKERSFVEGVTQSILNPM